MISIVMPVYNGERFLPEAIDSVLSQSYQDFEFVIVDDGSSDGTAEILRKYAASDSRISVIHQENRGVPASVNRAMNCCRHEWIARIDADDRMLPNRLERQLEFIRENPEISLACSYSYLINPQGKRIGTSENKVDVEAGRKNLDPRRFVEIVHSTVMMRRKDVLELGGYREDLLYGDDRELWGRMVTSGKILKCQNEVLMEYRLHTGALTVREVFGNEMTIRAIDLNIVRRLQGQKELTLEEVEAQYRSKPWLDRFNERRRFSAMRLYKNATRFYAEGKLPQFAVSLGLAVTFSPFRCIRRVLAHSTGT
jgi:glycosyltransferase involved in cell wall biosynthesis